MVKSIVAIDGPRVRFAADAFFALDYIFLLASIHFFVLNYHDICRQLVTCRANRFSISVFLILYVLVTKTELASVV